SMRVQRLEKRSREAAGRAQPRAGREAGQASDLDLRRAEVELPERLADDAVLHLVDPVHVLEAGVLEEDPRRKGAHHGDVDELVYGRRDEKAAVLLVVGREVGTAAAKGQAERAACDDHGAISGRLVRALPELAYIGKRPTSGGCLCIGR